MSKKVSILVLVIISLLVGGMFIFAYFKYQELSAPLTFFTNQFLNFKTQLT